jgi:hypothetical protein
MNSHEILSRKLYKRSKYDIIELLDVNSPHDNLENY